MPAKPGDFLPTRDGYGLILNQYKGDPKVFFGKTPIVGDVLHPILKRATKGMELSGFVNTKQSIPSKDMQKLIVAVFEKAKHR